MALRSNGRLEGRPGTSNPAGPPASQPITDSGENTVCDDRRVAVELAADTVQRVKLLPERAARRIDRADLLQVGQRAGA